MFMSGKTSRGRTAKRDKWLYLRPMGASSPLLIPHGMWYLRYRMGMGIRSCQLSAGTRHRDYLQQQQSLTNDKMNHKKRPGTESDVSTQICSKYNKQNPWIGHPISYPHRRQHGCIRVCIGYVLKDGNKDYIKNKEHVWAKHARTLNGQSCIFHFTSPQRGNKLSGPLLEVA